MLNEIKNTWFWQHKILNRQKEIREEEEKKRQSHNNVMFLLSISHNFT